MAKDSKSRKPEYMILILAMSVIFVLFLVFSFNKMGVKKSPALYEEDKTTQIKNAITKSEGNFEVILDIPSHLDESLAHPQKFFSGRKVKIIKKYSDLVSPTDSVSLVERGINKMNTISFYYLNTSKRTSTSFTIEIPRNVKTGFYTIEFEESGERNLVPLQIIGPTKEEERSANNPPEAMNPLYPGSIIRLGNQCYWESVMKVNPYNENSGYLVGGGSNPCLVQTSNAWNTFQTFNINDLVNPLIKRYRGDPKITFDYSGRFTLTSLFVPTDEDIPITGGIYQDTGVNTFPAQLNQTILQYEPPGLNYSIWWLLFDYPKIAIDNYLDSPFLNSIYVFAYAYFEDINDITGALFVIRDGHINKYKVRELGGDSFYGTPPSTLVGPGGIIYASFMHWPDGVKLFYSVNGGQTFFNGIIRQLQGYHCPARVSITSGRAWLAYGGPELAVDHAGRLYSLWAQPAGCYPDPNFEYETFGFDYNVYLSFSDNNGTTWNNPVRIDDDSNYGDQAFPSIFIDRNDTVYVTFLDHRDNQDEAQYDIYLSQSTDRGLSFSRNIKLNDQSVPNTWGFREPGDYLDMLAVGNAYIFVSYPCVNQAYPPWGGATDACISKITKPLEYEAQSPTNKIQNPSYEIDYGIDFYPNWTDDDSVPNNKPDGYVTTSSGILDSNIKYQGSKSIKLTTINNRGYSYQDIPVEYNKRYRVSGYVKTDCNDNNCYGTIISECRNIDHQPIWDYNNCKLNINPINIRRLYNDNNWTYIEFDIENNRQDGKFLRVLCYNTPGPNPVGSGIVWCDSMNVIEIPRSGGGSPLFLKIPEEGGFSE